MPSEPTNLIEAWEQVAISLREKGYTEEQLREFRRVFGAAASITVAFAAAHVRDGTALNGIFMMMLDLDEFKRALHQVP